MTTLDERRVRGDLIETHKILNGIVDFGKNLFRLSKSDRNILSKIDFSKSYSTKIRAAFLPDRVKNCWNNLPSYVKCSADVTSFKANLGNYKMEKILEGRNNFWEI